MSAKELLQQALARTSEDPNRAVLGGAGFPLKRTVPPGKAVVEAGGNVTIGPPALARVLSFAERSRDNLVIVGEIGQGLNRRITVHGSGNLIFIGDSPKSSPRISIVGDGNMFFAAHKTTVNNVNFVLKGTGRSIIIGQDCMFSQEISVRAGDSHAIFDLDTLVVMNESESVLFHPHVWVAEGATVLKGVTVGAGAVVGAAATVTQSIPPRALAIGTPARVVRENISWTRDEMPSEAKRRTVRDQLDAFG